MKRKQKKLNEVFKCFPWFFWKPCCSCNKEFVRERGWRFLSGPYFGGQGVWRYICNGCANTEEKASDVIDSAPWIPPRPKAPPAPPLPKKVA